MPAWDDRNACAVPAKLVTMVPGKVSRAAASTADTASLSDTPSARLNEMVTAGNCAA